ncbi:MAG: sodium:solute symporter [Phycisphaeraceae bacterium]|nr:sodium:solute symporter [Phycisphaeraceae bacterium]
MIQTTLAASGFSWLDGVVLGVYLLIIAVAGVLLSRGKLKNAREYFLGDRPMPVWAVACSVVATALSAATFVGGPQMSYDGDLTYLSANIGTVLAVLLVAWLFVPAFYRHQVMTVYELLEVEIGPRAKLAASAMFMIGRVFASGARLYIAAIPAALVMFDHVQTWQLVMAVIVLTIVGTLYTLMGGIKSVIWTDVMQLCVLVGAVTGAVIVLWSRIPVPTSEILEALRHPAPGEPSKLNVLDLGLTHGQVDFSQYFTLITALTGLLLFNLAAYGTDQDLAQRVLTCKSAAKGSWSTIVAILVSLPITLLFLVAGLLLYVFYKRPDVMGAMAPAYQPVESPKIFVSFILHEMPAGLRGLFLAGLFAVALGSFNSALNAMASTFVGDFYRRFRPDKPEEHYLSAGRWAMAMWGVVLGAFACFCVFWQKPDDPDSEKLINFALEVMNFAYSGLLGVFLTAMFTRRGSETSVIAALVTGFVVVLLMQQGIWEHWAPWGWHTVKVAFPWKMVAGTAAATLVCCLGRGRTAEQVSS